MLEKWSLMGGGMDDLRGEQIGSSKPSHDVADGIWGLWCMISGKAAPRRLVGGGFPHPHLGSPQSPQAHGPPVCSGAREGWWDGLESP